MNPPCRVRHAFLIHDEEEGEECPAMQPTAQVLTVGPCARTPLALRVCRVGGRPVTYRDMYDVNLR